MTRAFNHLIAGSRYAERFGRWPLPPDAAHATINDVIFARMIDPIWSPLERAFVDKATAKAEAQRLHPVLAVPETLAVLPMTAVPTVDRLTERLRPFAGAPAIAKPTHASGAATLLRDVAGPADLRSLHALASVDYAGVMREMQYLGLPRKIIVEALVPSRTAGPPDDYKFHCVFGEPLVVQVDHARFGTAWSRLLRVPDLAPMDPADGLAMPAGCTLPVPDRIAAMIAAARAISAPFAFVRVDLYDGRDGIYFGELTFTPAAALGIAPSAAGDHAVTDTHRRYSSILIAALRTGKATPH